MTSAKPKLFLWSQLFWAIRRKLLKSDYLKDFLSLNKEYHPIIVTQNAACKFACKNNNSLIINSKGAPAQGAEICFLDSRKHIFCCLANIDLFEVNNKHKKEALGLLYIWWIYNCQAGIRTWDQTLSWRAALSNWATWSWQILYIIFTYPNELICNWKGLNTFYYFWYICIVDSQSHNHAPLSYIIHSPVAGCVSLFFLLEPPDRVDT